MMGLFRFCRILNNSTYVLWSLSHQWGMSMYSLRQFNVDVHLNILHSLKHPNSNKNTHGCWWFLPLNQLMNKNRIAVKNKTTENIICPILSIKKYGLVLKIWSVMVPLKDPRDKSFVHIRESFNQISFFSIDKFLLQNIIYFETNCMPFIKLLATWTK